jgi:hypothetical protein
MIYLVLSVFQNKMMDLYEDLYEYQNYTVIYGDSKGRMVCLELNTLEP